MNMQRSTLELQLTLGESLALARKAEGLTQGELAEESGLSRATIANIESGGADPKVSTIAELAKALDMSPAWLLMSEEDMKVIGKMAASDDISRYQDMLSDDVVSKISTMVRSGGKKRLEAALEELEDALRSDEGDTSEDESSSSEEEDPGLKVSKTAKMAVKAGSSLAAVGTKLAPGVGTAIGAAWSKVRSDSSGDSEED